MLFQLCMRALVAAGYWALCVLVGVCVHVCTCVHVCLCVRSARVHFVASIDSSTFIPVCM